MPELLKVGKPQMAIPSQARRDTSREGVEK
jgi:hypothetical protein